MRRNFARPRRGQSLAELALIMPLCLWILLGIVDFGRVFYFYVGATNAAREGARYWASNATATETAVKGRVQAEAAPQIAIPAGNITLTTPASDRRKVEVQLQFDAVTPLIGSLWGGGPLTITTHAVMPTLN